MKIKSYGVDIEVEECRIPASSPRDAFLSYGSKLEVVKFPKVFDIDIIFEKYTINKITCKWRFGDNKVYQLRIRDINKYETTDDILYKYIWKTILQEIGSGTIRLSYPDYPELCSIEDYLFNDEFYNVGIALIDELMKKLKEGI